MSDDGGHLDKEAVSTCMVAVMMSVDQEAHGFRCDRFDLIGDARREIGELIVDHHHAFIGHRKPDVAASAV